MYEVSHSCKCSRRKSPHNEIDMFVNLRVQLSPVFIISVARVCNTLFSIDDDCGILVDAMVDKHLNEGSRI